MLLKAHAHTHMRNLIFIRHIIRLQLAQYPNDLYRCYFYPALPVARPPALNKGLGVLWDGGCTEGLPWNTTCLLSSTSGHCARHAASPSPTTTGRSWTNEMRLHVLVLARNGWRVLEHGQKSTVEHGVLFSKTGSHKWLNVKTNP
jgi:hypothetical protein